MIFQKLRDSNSKRKISTHFRNVNIALFFLSSFIIVLVVLIMLENIADTVSKDYARLYSTNTSGAFSAYLNKEIALVQKAAHSQDVIDWFADEYNQEKKSAAHSEMLEIIEVLNSDNMYLGIQKFLNEYTIEEYFTVDDIMTHTALVPDYSVDAWYFECLNSENSYVLNVDIDKILNRKLVWINHRVESKDGIPLGVISTGLEFAETVEAHLSEYDSSKVRGLIIDSNGVVQMDSINMGDEDFLRYEDFYQIESEFDDPAFLFELNKHLNSIDGFFSTIDPIVIKLSSGLYSYATIAQIEATNWSVVTFYNASSLFSISKLIPLFIMLIIMLICYTIITSSMGYRLLFQPIKLLIDSLSRVSSEKGERIYGLERKDEIGGLSNAIEDMLNKVHVDPLTGIFNRRYMEEGLKRTTKTIVRFNGMLSVLMIDIDFFKKYNDTYGHSKGDECLRAVARVLGDSIVRAEDFVARFGGEEFIVILPNTNEAGAQSVAERMIDSVRALEIPHEKSETAKFVTISIGATTVIVNQKQTEASYIKRADEALYISKQTGRNKYTFLAFHDEQNS